MSLKKVIILRIKNTVDGNEGINIIELIIITCMISLYICFSINFLGMENNNNTDFYARKLVRDINEYYEKGYILEEKYYLEFYKNGYIIKGIEDNILKKQLFEEDIIIENVNDLECIRFSEIKQFINNNSRIVIQDVDSSKSSVVTIVPTSGRMAIKK